jgi:hypothetical protein
MKKTSTILILGLALMLLIVGCSTSANTNQYDYVPYGGQGCGFSADYDVSSGFANMVESNNIETLSFV